MKTRLQFCLLAILSLLLAVLPSQAAQSAQAASVAPGGLLQFNSGGQALGLAANQFSSARTVVKAQSDAYPVASTFRYPMDEGFQRYWTFGSYQASCGPYHNGVDYYIAPYVAPGSNIYAVANGKVLISQNDQEGFGNYIFIEHTLPGGLKVYSLYAHLSDRKVNVGDPPVTIGQVIGHEGNTGDGSNGVYHLHFELRKNPFQPDIDKCGNYSSLEYLKTRFYDPDDFIPSHMTHPENVIIKDFGISIPWWYTFHTCDGGDINVSLDGETLFTVSASGMVGGARTKFLWAGSHELKIVFSNTFGGQAPNIDYRLYDPIVPYVCAGGNPTFPPTPPPDEPQPTPGTTPPPPATTDNATFTGYETIPDGSVVSPGQGLVKTWRVKNTGTSTWGSGYQLAFTSGEQMGAPNTVNVPVTAPNATADISINLTAPTASGDHTGYWQMHNPQGTYFGPQIWVKVKTVADSGGGGTTHITLFDVSPASPSAATSVHLVARISAFPEFRSMRFVTGNNTFEMTNFRQVGSQYEISVDWNTASLARGDYAITLEVATQGDTSWANPERQVKTYTLNGTPASTNRPPDRPVLLSPYNWYLEDAAGASAQVQMCVASVNDPDGDAVEYYFEWSGANPGNSGWVSSTCVSPTLSPNGYAWHAKARDSQGAESGWSVDTWNFNVASGGVTIGSISGAINYADLDQSYICVPVTYGGIQGPEVKGFINLKADGSENGEWRQLDGFGPNAESCSQSNTWGFKVHVVNYVTGSHRIRVNAVKPDSGASAIAYYNFDMPYLRPPAPRAIAPSNNENNGTWWNTRAITFQWQVPLRTDSQTLRVSTSSDVWGDPAPLLEVPLNNTASQYTHTFNQDYAQLHWSVRATNSAGSADFGSGIWFGIDLVKPSCQVQPLPATTYESVFQVTWSGSDNMSGVRSYAIQSQDSERGAWDDWLTGIPATKTYDLFTGQPGHTYSFRCLASDNANNLGSYPSTADTQILVDPTSRPPTAWWNAAYSGKRNLAILNNMPGVTLPTGYTVHLHFDSNTTPTAAELFNASQATPKCNDLRVVYNDTVEIDRIVGHCDSSAIDLWFRTQVSISGGASNSTAHQLYYGNPNPGTPPADRNQVLYPALDSDYLSVFDMREGSGSVLHDAMGGGDATIDPALSWVATDKFGTALLIPGDPAPEPRYAIYAGYKPQPSCSFTAEIWLNRTPGATYDHVYLMSQEDTNSSLSQWDFRIGEDNHLAFSVADPAGDYPTVYSNQHIDSPIFFNNWHHLAVTFNCNNGEVNFYIDGVLDSTRYVSPGLRQVSAPLRIGYNPYNNERVAGMISGAALSDVVRTNFSYGLFGAITNEPLLVAGGPLTPPAAGNPDLAVLSLATYPNPDGSILVEALIQNQGNLDTQNGFYTDLYLNHVPTGAGDYTGSLQFWVNNPIPAGGTATLTTVMHDMSGLSGMAALAPGSESSGTLYAQADSTGAVSEPDESNNIYSAGTQICIATADAYEGDNTAGTASTISLGHTQTHNFDRMGDQDWIKFTAQAGKKYRLTTSNLGVSADTYLYLYSTNGQTLLVSNDDYNNSLASQIDWIAPQNGTYYAVVKHWNPGVEGCGTSYNFSISNITPSLHIYLPLVIR